MCPLHHITVYTFSYTVAVRGTIRNDDDDDSSGRSSNAEIELDTAVSFYAADVAAAKQELLQIFGTAHSNGRVRCINSRANYAYCQCSKCRCTAAVKQSKENPKMWTISAVADKARRPCVGSAPVAPSVDPVPPLPPVIVTRVNSTPSVVPVLPQPSVSIVPHVPGSVRCCASCEEQFQEDGMFVCPNPSAHILCQECFELNVSSQFGEDLALFVNRKCSVVCNYCVSEAGKDRETLPFNMQALIPR